MDIAVTNGGGFSISGLGPAWNAGNPGATNARRVTIQADDIIHRAADRIELSDRARLMSLMRHMPNVRHDRVQQVRDAIADGSYETSDKLDQALSALLDELA